jgi:chromosome segregation ATPase
MNDMLTAARQPLNLLVLVVAVLVGLTVANWLLVVGVLAYLVAVFLTARDPATGVAAQRSARRASIAKINSPTFRAILNEIDTSQREIERSIAQTSGPLARLLGGVKTQTGDLVDQAHELARKGEIIEQYMKTINLAQLQTQIAHLDGQIARTHDTYTLQQLQETKRALVDRQSNASALQTYIDRINAQLQNIDANLDNVLAETVRLRTADTVSANSASNQVAERLRDLNADMDAFQRVLDTALVQTGAS